MTLGSTQYQGTTLEGKGGRCMWLTALPPSCADCLKIMGASTSWSPRSLSGPVQGRLYLYLFSWDYHGMGWTYKRVTRKEEDVRACSVFVECPCKAIVSIVFLILALLERNVSRPSSYRVVNTIQLGYKHQSFSASYDKSCFLNQRHKCNMWAEHRLGMSNLVVHKVTGRV